MTELIPSLHMFKLPLLLMGVVIYGGLMYILVAVLHDFCVVCSLLYLIHGLLVTNHIIHCCRGELHKPPVKKQD